MAADFDFVQEMRSVGQRLLLKLRGLPQAEPVEVVAFSILLLFTGQGARLTAGGWHGGKRALALQLGDKGAELCQRDTAGAGVAAQTWYVCALGKRPPQFSPTAPPPNILP